MLVEPKGGSFENDKMTTGHFGYPAVEQFNLPTTMLDLDVLKGKP